MMTLQVISIKMTTKSTPMWFAMEFLLMHSGDGEGLRIGLRFMCLSDDGRIMIVDLPTAVHECTARSFDKVRRSLGGCDSQLASKGSMTVSRDALPNKEADATFGPKGSTPNRTPAPAPRIGVADWVTLAVECPQMRYALYDSRTRPSPTTRPAVSGTFRHQTTEAAVNVTFDMHRILSIPADQDLPNGVNPVAVVNLRMQSSTALNKSSFE
ncbi:hypothetical protein PHPALM_17563 [Phytophthora palmivora]|uniref:Uncharacterized protein n=1 Tax=Phytophthora palmivora TaxID=4796 RepID=A0A2P4XLY8_9STRA|nr:hypothetical protein PHPALM_17563 [Phytophthora palmivora]